MDRRKAMLLVSLLIVCCALGLAIHGCSKDEASEMIQAEIVGSLS
jgi:hypothetical protein